MTIFNEPAAGRWQTMGQFLTWVAENQKEVEEYLNLPSGNLSAWIEEFSLPKKTDPDWICIEFYNCKQIYDEDDVNEEPYVSITALSSKYPENEWDEALVEKHGGIPYSFSSLSPLEYWYSPIKLYEKIRICDFRNRKYASTVVHAAPLTVGQVVAAWRHEITWEGNSPAEREEMINSLKKLVEDIDKGEVELIPAEEVFKEMRDKVSESS